MDDLDLVKARLAGTPISRIQDLADATGVPFGTLFKVKYGTTKNPRYDTVKPLAEYFRAHPEPAGAQ